MSLAWQAYVSKKKIHEIEVRCLSPLLMYLSFYIHAFHSEHLLIATTISNCQTTCTQILSSGLANSQVHLTFLNSSALSVNVCLKLIDFTVYLPSNVYIQKLLFLGVIFRKVQIHKAVGITIILSFIP